MKEVQYYYLTFMHANEVGNVQMFPMSYFMMHLQKKVYHKKM